MAGCPKLDAPTAAVARQNNGGGGGTAAMSSGHVSANGSCASTSSLVPSVSQQLMASLGDELLEGGGGRSLLVALALFNLIFPDKALTERAKQLWISLSKSSDGLQQQLLKEANVLVKMLQKNNNGNAKSNGCTTSGIVVNNNTRHPTPDVASSPSSSPSSSVGPSVSYQSSTQSAGISRAAPAQQRQDWPGRDITLQMSTEVTGCCHHGHDEHHAECQRETRLRRDNDSERDFNNDHINAGNAGNDINDHINAGNDINDESSKSNSSRMTRSSSSSSSSSSKMLLSSFDNNRITVGDCERRKISAAAAAAATEEEGQLELMPQPLPHCGRNEKDYDFDDNDVHRRCHQHRASVSSNASHLHQSNTKKRARTLTTTTTTATPFGLGSPPSSYSADTCSGIIYTCSGIIRTCSGINNASSGINHTCSCHDVEECPLSQSPVSSASVQKVRFLPADRASFPPCEDLCLSVGTTDATSTDALLASAPQSPKTLNPVAVVKIYADGVFDLMHSGHFNALRQAKMLGHILVVGVNSDAEVKATKGIAPIYSQRERSELVRGCKWVDAVVEGTPYSVSLEFLAEMGCDFVAHGDDFAPDADGNDCYSEPAAAGKLKIFRRTLGISSTTLICRLLWATADLPSAHKSVGSPKPIREWLKEQGVTQICEGKSETPAQRILQFIGNRRQPRHQDAIVYLDGSFDVFHVGHLRILQKAKSLGDYLIVGIHDDETVARVKGEAFPVMNVVERALNVLAMKVVDEVIIGAPWVVTEELIKSFGISIVACGKRIDGTGIPVRVGSYNGSLGPDAVGRPGESQRTMPAGGIPPDGIPVASALCESARRRSGSMTSRDVTNNVGGIECDEDQSRDDLGLGGDHHNVGGIETLAAATASASFSDDDTSDPSSALPCTEGASRTSSTGHTTNTSSNDTSQFSFHEECYQVAKRMGIFVTLDSESTITTGEIISRIVARREILLSSIGKRSQKEFNVHRNTRPISKELRQLVK